MEQRSSEWYSIRQKKIGASDAGPILGLNPHKSAYQVWLSKQDGYVEEDNLAMKRGRDLESEALQLFETETGYLMSPKVLISAQNSFMMASLDGYDALDGKAAVEIKCPSEKTHLKAIHGEIPKYYIAQMQHQMHVTELHEIYYCSYRPEHHVNPLYIEIVKRDENFISDMIEKESLFYHNHMLPKIPPEKFPKMKEFKKMNSQKWKDLVDEYKSIQKVLKEAEEKKALIRDFMLQVSQGEEAQGFGITLQRIEKKGIIDYQNIPILKTMNLEEFRKPGSSYWQIKECENGPSTTI